MKLLRAVLPLAALALTAGLVSACSPGGGASSGPAAGSMRAVPPPDVINSGNPGTGNRERVFDSNRGAPL